MDNNGAVSAVIEGDTGSDERTIEDRLDAIEQKLNAVMQIADAAGNFLGYAAKEIGPILDAVKSNPMLKNLIGFSDNDGN